MVQKNQQNKTLEKNQLSRKSRINLYIAIEGLRIQLLFHIMDN